MPALNYADALALGAPAAAAHLDWHRVWPMPPPYLEPPMGIVNTPDTLDLFMDGNTRLTMKVRPYVLPGAAGDDMFLSAQWDTTVVSPNAWFIATRSSGFIVGRMDDASVRLDYALMSVPEMQAALPVGVDAYVGAIIRPTGPTANVGMAGIKSADGVTWEQVRLNPSGRWVWRDPASPLVVGGYLLSGASKWKGRIYWMQMEAIERARLILSGYGGSCFIGPTLWGTGGTTQGVEILIRVAAAWTQTPSDFQGFVYAPARLGVRRTATNTLNFYTYGADGTATSPAATVPAGWTDNQPVWLRLTHDGTTLTMQWALDQPGIPTTWTDLRAPMAAGSAGLRAATGALMLGADSAGVSRLMVGRLARVIIRDTIGGAPVFELNENDAGAMAEATSFVTRTGHTITVPNVTGSGAFLDTVAYATTPDAPELQIVGDVRITAKVRDDSTEAALSRMIIDRSTGGYAWRFSTYGAPVLVIGWPTGGTSPQIGPSVGNRSDFGLTPPGADPVYLGAELVGVDPSSQALSLVATGLTSPDGTTWAKRPPAGAVRADAYSFKSTGPLRINYQWTGRIYWAQVEAINRRSFVFPGTSPASYMIVPDSSALNFTGPFEIVFRAAMDWQSQSAGVDQQYILAKFGAAGQRGYAIRFDLAFPGRVRLVRSSDGSTTSDTSTATVAVPFTRDQPGWVKVTTDAVGTARFYTAPDAGTNAEPTTWTQLGGDRTGYSPVTWASTIPLWIGAGAYTSGGGPLNGRIGRIIMRNGIGGPVVFDLNTSNLPNVAVGATALKTSDTVDRYTRFPGVLDNYLAVPHQASFQTPGSFEVVTRAGLDWHSATNVNTFGSRYATTGLGGRSWYFYMDTAYPGRPRLAVSQDGSTGNTGTSSTAVPFATGAIGWLKGTFDAPTGTIRFYTAPDAGTTVEPVTWTQLGTDRTGIPTSVFPGTARFLIGRHDVSENGPFAGRMSRFILRNGIGGTVLFDYDAAANLKEVDPLAGSFALTTGGTATVNRAGSPQLELITGRYPVTVNQQAGVQVVQALPDAVVWRFDAEDAAAAGTLVYTDPRGRTWTLTAPPVPANGVPIVQPQPDRVMWRFDANDWPAGATTVVDATGRTWTASNGAAVQHPASIPDQEVIDVG